MRFNFYTSSVFIAAGITALAFLATGCGQSLPSSQGNGSPETLSIVAETPTPTATPNVTVSSCREILQNNPGSSDGTYAILLADNSVANVFCDMTTDGGGWTVILDGANADRVALNYFFENASEAELPESDILRDQNKGIFWNGEYLRTKNMPANSQFRVIVNLSYLDDVYGTMCRAIIGFKSPNGWQSGDSQSFTGFVQKNDDSQYLKATLNDFNISQYQSVKVNENVPYAYPMANGSYVWAGNPEGAGNTCHTLFFKRLMVR